MLRDVQTKILPCKNLSVCVCCLVLIALLPTVARAFQPTPSTSTSLLFRRPNHNTRQQDHILKMSKTTTQSIDDIYALTDREGKVVPAIPTPAFLGMCLVGVPVWLTVLLPLSVVTQLGKAIIKPFQSKPNFCIDTGTQVDASDISPRKNRKYDAVVLGATGFTGKLVVEHLCRTYGGKRRIDY